mmetsp:Transcript_11243/g.46934  ORF Transcript_11243/g.46934 Transcript_11243/m.46934 type:complete len:243 (-) Transcript_11243:560-1288(-)
MELVVPRVPSALRPERGRGRRRRRVVQIRRRGDSRGGRGAGERVLPPRTDSRRIERRGRHDAGHRRGRDEEGGAGPGGIPRRVRVGTRRTAQGRPGLGYHHAPGQEGRRRGTPPLLLHVHVRPVSRHPGAGAQLRPRQQARGQHPPPHAAHGDLQLGPVRRRRRRRLRPRRRPQRHQGHIPARPRVLQLRPRPALSQRFPRAAGAQDPARAVEARPASTRVDHAGEDLHGVRHGPPPGGEAG